MTEVQVLLEVNAAVGGENAADATIKSQVNYLRKLRLSSHWESKQVAAPKESRKRLPIRPSVCLSVCLSDTRRFCIGITGSVGSI